MTSCAVTQEELGQRPEKCKEDTQCVTGRSIDGASGGNAEKAGWKADSVQSIENRQFYETKGEKHQFIHESFQLDTNKISNADAKLKEAVNKFFLDNFKV